MYGGHFIIFFIIKEGKKEEERERERGRSLQITHFLFIYYQDTEERREEEEEEERRKEDKKKVRVYFKISVLQVHYINTIGKQ